MNNNIKVVKLNNNLFIGGMFCYSVNKKGAKYMLDFIDKHGKGYGFCSDSDNMYSFMCYAEPPSVADVKNKIAGMFS